MDNRKHYNSNYGYKVSHIISNDISKSYFSTWHYDPNLMIAYFKKADGKAKIEGSIYNISDGDVIILSYNEIHFIDLLNEPGERITLHLDIDIFSKHPEGVNELLYPFFRRTPGIGNYISKKDVTELGIDILFEEISLLLSKGNDISDLLSFTKLIELLNIINQTSLFKEPSDDSAIYNGNVKNILKYINKNFLGDIDTDSIAKEVGLSKYYLCRIFKDSVGISIGDYIINRRIFHFHDLVRNGATLEDAVFNSGFNNYSNFFRLYKKRMDMSPMEFKKKCKK